MRQYYLISILFLLKFNSVGATYQVGEKGQFKTIKQAIQHAQNGDSLLVNEGVYREGTIEINKKLVLIGLNYPVLDGQKKYEVVTISADGVVFKGFRVERSGHATLHDPGGIRIYQSRNVLICDNILDDNFFGIYIQFSKKCTLKNNKIRAYGKEEQLIGNGIHSWKSDSLLIISNTIEGHRDGIYLEFVTNSLVWRNLSIKNIRYGLHFMFSHNDAYIGNVFKLNGAGVAVMFTNHVKMINNVFQENWGDASFGLMLKEISDGYIYGNRFTKNTTGIFMEGTSRLTVEKNSFSQNGWGMKIQASCMENSICENNFVGNTFDISTNGATVLNSFSRNYWDKYNGYDLNHDLIGDVPFHPLSIFSIIVEQTPPAMLLFRSFIVDLLDKSEKISPSLTPVNFEDLSPSMRPYAF